MPEKFSRAGTLLLVVDDEPLICWALQERLREAGYQVLAASDAASALSHFDGRAAAEPVDLVLLDLKLPDIDGLNLFEQIKRLKPNCQAIMMTAFASPEKTDEARQLGIYHVVNKPFDLGEMVTLVEEALAARTAAATSPPQRQ
jgi:DNA-binding NtrC family response regulator